ncbi:hypothetical protein [Rhizobium leguminosarum]|uniref:hypothetical protein n=1 Tax=Rhizobium TaxID=379 RepID=UPI0010301DD9|nr:hypothetical protein [Rhizobium leguminosarum]TAV40666.1 hypothetical protein ELI31_35400 [Rhizobium leguminosarum]TAV41234.1 hypothetical protein ELI32_35395 [Rhizobium leguminosarum]TAV61099.1 hypothetical protein ELI30_35185 [Rhizobium leguminosarum]TAY61123.1 hypothetical protein ELH82_33055 [Rhizobium leguminosarum]
MAFVADHDSLRWQGEGVRVPAFFDVSPPDASGRRTFIPHSSAQMSVANIRTPQQGPNDLPVVSSTNGQLFEIVTPPAGPEGGPLVEDLDGNVSEVGRVEVDKGQSKPTLFGTDGQKIDAFPEVWTAVPEGAVSGAQIAVARKFSVGGKSVLLDAAGDVIQTEVGQASTGGVLLSQKNSLVYYVITVNDVFAYMVTGAANGAISPTPTQFPVTQGDLDKITAFANANQKTFAAPEALTLELKTSWVEASSIADTSGYITMEATVPTFDTSDPIRWQVNGQKTARLAMVGMHVVGSTKGHPEMIWATFEHADNVPVGAYSYLDTAGNTKTVAQPNSGTWLFSAGNLNPADAFNLMGSQFDSGEIIPADGSASVAPTNTIRWKAWGAVSGTSPNPIAGSDTASNTEIISMNNSVRNQLAAGDVRANYVFVGATWTILGQPPTPVSNQVGTSMLANSTMETYMQGTSAHDEGSNCFSCHRSNQVGVSRIYKSLNPLF